MLKIQNLTKNFGSKNIIQNFSYTFNDKGLYLIKGVSGAGKTTFLRMISGLDEDYSGIITSSGKFSYAFQEHRLIPTLSAIDNVLLSSFEIYTPGDYEATVSLFRYFGFTDKDMKLLPSELSGGMKQRVSLIRAFMFHSDILLLDEPTKELDSELTKRLCNYIEEESKNRLVILVSHDVTLNFSNAETITI